MFCCNISSNKLSSGSDFGSSSAELVLKNTFFRIIGSVTGESFEFVLFLDRYRGISLTNGFKKLFESESSTELAKVVIDLLRDESKRKGLSGRGKERAKQFDWTVVAQQIFSVYEMSIVGSQKVRLASDTRPWNRFLSKEEK